MTAQLTFQQLHSTDRSSERAQLTGRDEENDDRRMEWLEMERGTGMDGAAMMIRLSASTICDLRSFTQITAQPNA